MLKQHQQNFVLTQEEYSRFIRLNRSFTQQQLRAQSELRHCRFLWSRSQYRRAIHSISMLNSRLSALVAGQKQILSSIEPLLLQDGHILNHGGACDECWDRHCEETDPRVVSREDVVMDSKQRKSIEVTLEFAEQAQSNLIRRVRPQIAQESSGLVRVITTLTKTLMAQKQVFTIYPTYTRVQPIIDFKVLMLEEFCYFCRKPMELYKQIAEAEARDELKRRQEVENERERERQFAANQSNHSQYQH